MSDHTCIPDPRETPTMSVPEAGLILGLSRPAAYAAAKRGEIPTLQLGRRMIVPTATLLKMLGLTASGAAVNL
jgi:hypothetical protein